MSLTRLEISGHFPHPHLAAPRSGNALIQSLLSRSSFLPHRSDFEALREETDPQIIRENLQQLADLLLNEGHDGLAQELYQSLLTTEDAIAETAQARLDAATGVGAVLPRAEYLSRRLASHATELAPLAGMATAGFLFRAVRFSLLSRLALTPQAGLARIWGSRALVNLAAFAVEVPAFTAGTRAADLLLGHELDWSGRALGRELVSGALVLGSLKVFGALANGLGNRLFPGAVTEASLARRFVPGALHQTGTYLGILTGHHLEEWVGLRPRLGGATTMIDSLATLLQFHAAGRLTQGVFWESLGRSERELDALSERLNPRPPLPTLAWRPRLPDLSTLREPLRAAAIAPLWMMMGAGSAGGGGHISRRPSARYRAPMNSPRVVASPHLPNILRALDQIPRLEEYRFDDVAYHIFDLYARRAEIPFDIYLGRALRAAPQELLEHWINYYFDPEFQGAVPEEVLSWLRQHHLHRGVPLARTFLSHPDSAVRIEALQTLERFLRDRATPDLISHLADQALMVRLQAADLLMSHGINAALPVDRARYAEENREQSVQTKALIENIRTDHSFPAMEIEVPVPRITAEVADTLLLENLNMTELVVLARDHSAAYHLRHRAVGEIESREIRHAVPALRQVLQDKGVIQLDALRALDRVLPEWDYIHRKVGSEIMTQLGSEWLRRFPRASMEPSLRRALESLGVLERAGSSGNSGAAILTLAAVGTSLATWFSANPALARVGEAAVSGEAASWLPLVLLGGLATVFSINLARLSSAPPAPPIREALGHFESVYDANERYSVARPANGEVLPVGRSSSAHAGVFPPELRHIARQHLEIQEVDGRIEVRASNRARGVRINGHNLTFNNWYVLNEGDLIEFVSEPRSDILIWQEDPNLVDQLVQTPLRLGEVGLESAQGSDQPAIFRFRRAAVLAAEPPQTIPPPPNDRLLQMIHSIQNFFAKPRAEIPESRESVAPEAAAPRPPSPAAIDIGLLSRDILRFSGQIQGAINLYEAGLGEPNSFQASSEVLHALVVAHRSFCGTSERTQTVGNPAEGLRVSTLSLIRVPHWDGVLSQRLQYYEAALNALPENERASPHSEGARTELSRIRDRLNRLLEIVNLYRMYYAQPEEQAIFDAIERAYHGLRQPKTRPAARVRSLTRTLDTVVRNREREIWMQDFLINQPPSRAVINMRILMGEIEQVRGEAVIGSFYRALENGDRDHGIRMVRAHYDLESGELVGFNDGTREVQRAIRVLERQGRRLAEIELQVDTTRSGRILEITGFHPETRESIRLGLVMLKGLQVLPDNESYPPPRPEPDADVSGVREIIPFGDDPTARPEPASRVIQGTTELDPESLGERWSILLLPPGNFDPRYLRRVEAITPILDSIGPDGSPRIFLLTLEGYEPAVGDTGRDSNPGLGSLQLWVNAADVVGLQAGDVVAVSRSE